MSIKEQNVSNNLASQFRCSRRCFTQAIFCRLSVQCKDTEFSSVFFNFLTIFLPFFYVSLTLLRMGEQSSKFLNLNQHHLLITWSHIYKKFGSRAKILLVTLKCVFFYIMKIAKTWWKMMMFAELKRCFIRCTLFWIFFS